ncbi:type I polyketide synthase [Actinokineospora globicatena]|uniref:Acyl transferase domain-containing protein n=1 Tax=Actinokineospora globicatena TaxID=103729 RepID=A0A9W6V7Z9_9PSEU|nr:beta-ketoacyl synthase N-terminal-like domain-containing protein [Actinokineospora globicatena]GLW90454.1 hypothetical protein Aglo03_12700 [Actinokineospora globicatena]
MSPETEGRIAITGMACRFPGARDAGEFWDLLVSGRSGIARFSRDELLAEGVDAAEIDHPDYVAAAADVPGVDLFDAKFFGCTDKAAGLLDPQHRLFLETAWAALEDAACDPAAFSGSIGVFAGQGSDDYRRLLGADPTVASTYSPKLLDLSTGKDFLATRTAFSLGLTGPAITVQTACSTSLVAVHLACQSLLNGECDTALAGAVALRAPQGRGYLRDEGMASDDGQCRVFDADANGSVPSGGVGVLVLKPLADALADGDPVHAVILGSAVNNDGSSKVGFSAPGVDRQAAVIEEALAVAGVPAESIGYVEAHGTGTPLGDPIEVAALARAFGPLPAESCWLGSVKSNIGHADAAAGMAGLIKVVLALRHGVVPPSLGFRSANPEIDFAATPFRVLTETAPWPREPRRAGVSSFGIGGTNAHVVVEAAPDRPGVSTSDGPELLVLSARTPTALAARREDLADFLRTGAPDLAAVANTLRRGRAEFGYRTAIAAVDRADAVEQLAAASGHAVPDDPPGVVFLYPGGAAQHAGMSAGLYQGEPVFRAAADELLDLHSSPAVDALVRGGDVPEGGTTAPGSALVGLFIVEYALTRLWESWGVRPAAVLGHSSGEYAAACAAGVLTPADALRVVVFRGSRMEELPPGRMLAVPLTEAEVLDRLADSPDLVVAAVNAAESVVVAGPHTAVAAFAAALTADGVDAQVVGLDVASHSPLVEPILPALADLIGELPLRPPTLPVVSGATGQWSDDLTTPEYWVRHLRGPVRFRDAIQTLLAAGHRTFLEVGPGRMLTSLARRNADGAPGVVAVSSLPHSADTRPQPVVFRGAVGALWCAGVPMTWPETDARSVHLPTYPFDRRSFWAPVHPSPLDPPSPPETRPTRTSAMSTPSSTADLDGVRADLRKVVSDFLGGAPEEIPGDVTFLDQGADSLVIAQLARAVGDRLGVRIPFRQLLVKYPTVDTLAVQVLSLRPAEQVPEPVEPEEPAPSVVTVVLAQLELMREQLAALRERG